MHPEIGCTSGGGKQWPPPRRSLGAHAPKAMESLRIKRGERDSHGDARVTVPPGPTPRINSFSQLASVVRLVLGVIRESSGTRGRNGEAGPLGGPEGSAWDGPPKPQGSTVGCRGVATTTRHGASTGNS